MSLILEAREKRAKHIEELIKKFKNNTIVIFKLNVPGENKNLVKLKFIYKIYDQLIQKEFNNLIINKGKTKSDDGDYLYYIINERGNIVKEKTIFMEDNNRLGKLIDIDVYDKVVISRTDLSYEMRKCLICNNYAHICVRTKAHTQKELFIKIDEIIINYLTNYILDKTINAIYSELKVYPKFGLVSIQSNGIHSDMTYQTFIDSTNIITPYLKEFILYGLNELDDPLILKQIGEKAEEAMFKETNSINTQKGLIFILGIFLPVISKSIKNNLGQKSIEKEIIKVSKTIIGNYYSNLTKKSSTSHGDLIYLKYNIKGIRGEVLNGLKIIFDVPSYKGSFANLEYLIYIMSLLDDTTIIHRTNLETLNNVKKTMKHIVKIGGYTNNKELVNNLSDEYIKLNISPGGAADILVVKILYEDLKELL